jgi:hypothetical protein
VYDGRVDATVRVSDLRSPVSKAGMYLIQVGRGLKVSVADRAHVLVLNVIVISLAVPAPPLPTPVVTALTKSSAS